MPSKRKANTNKIKPIITSNKSLNSVLPFTIPEVLKKQEIKGLLIGLLVLVSIYFLRGVLIAATVNGKPVSRIQLIKELEKQNGKETLNTLITKELILQEASRQKVAVTDKELDEEVKKIEENVEKQGQKLDDLLKAQNLTRDSLKEQLKIEKTIQKLLGKDIVISDKEVEDYIAQNKASFPPTAQIEELKEPVKQQLQQQKMSEKFESWLADLQKKAKIHYFLNF